MKKSNIIKGVAALSVLSLVGGGIMVAQAASNNSNGLFGGRGIGKHLGKQADLSSEQKAEMQTKMEAVRAAVVNSDYSAWVTAMKAIDENSPALKQVSADNFSEYVAKQQEMETKMTQRNAQREAIEKALDNGDYSAWVTAVKAENENCPLLTKINASNFSTYVQAHNLRQQANEILKNLGIEDEKGFGEMGRGHGPKGMGMGIMGDAPEAPVNN